MNKKRILFVSNFCLANSGFGKYQKNLLSRLYKTKKYEIAELACGVSDQDPMTQKLPWKVYGVLPKTQEESIRFNSADENTKRAYAYGLFRFDEAVSDFKPDIVISHEDVWQASSWLKQSKTWGKFIPVQFNPFDAEPMTDIFVDFLKDIKHVYTYGKWSQQIGFKANLLQTKVATLGIDQNIFKPLDALYIKQLRMKWGIKDTDFVVTMVARNQIRKKYDALFESLNEIDKINPELYKNIKILPFAFYQDEPGINFPKFWKSRNIDESKIITPYFCEDMRNESRGNGCKAYHVASKYEGEAKDCPICGTKGSCHTPSVISGFTDEQLNEIYNISDLFVLPTTNEGFSVPTCTTPNTIVIDNKFQGKRIKDIIIGDKMMDSNGNENLALETIKRKYSGDILCIKAAGIPTIEVTPDHPFLIERNEQRIFIEAKELKSGDNLLTPIPSKNIDIEKIKLKSFGFANTYLNTHIVPKDGSLADFAKKIGYAPSTVYNSIYNSNKIKSNGRPVVSKETSSLILKEVNRNILEFKKWENDIPEYLFLNEDNLFALGLYVAEGCCSEENEVMFTFNKNETKYAEKSERLLKQMGCSTKISIIKNTCRVWGRVRGIKKFFHIFGTSCVSKCIPDFIFNLPQQKLQHFLLGYFCGDGCFSGRYCVTVSLKLAFQIRFLLLKCGFLTNFYIIQPRRNVVIKGKEYNCKRQYMISFGSQQSFLDFSSLKKNSISSKKHIFFPSINNNYLYTPIKKITIKQYNGYVYNVDTDNNSTFLINGVVSHNCEALSAGKMVAVTNYSTCAELAKDSGAGFLFDCSLSVEHGTFFYKANITPREIANQINKIYNIKPEVRKELEKKAREYAVTVHNYDKLAKDWENEIDAMQVLENVDWNTEPVIKNPNPNGLMPPCSDDISWVCALYKNILDADVIKETNGKPIENQGVQYWMMEIQQKKRTKEQIEEYFRQIANEDLKKKTVDIRTLLDPLDTKRMLYVMAVSAGDNFLSTAIVKSLKEKYPDHSIYIASKPEFEGIWKGNPDIKRWLPFGDAMLQYGWGIDRWEKGIFDIVLTPTILTQMNSPNWHNNGKTESFLINGGTK